MDELRWLVRQQAALGTVQAALEAAADAVMADRSDKVSSDDEDDEASAGYAWQRLAVSEVFRDPETSRWPRPTTYMRRVLQAAVKRAELDPCGVCDELADCLAEAIVADVNSDNGMRHDRDNFPWSWFSLGPKSREQTVCRVRVCNAGMDRVGHLPWEAGIMLGDWAMLYPERFRGKHVLELGAGTGVSGMVIDQELEPASVVLTDYGRSELDNLEAIVEANKPSRAKVARFDWFTAKDDLEAICGEQDIDIVIAGDCIYDPELLQPFLNALTAVFDMNSKADAYVLSTQRSERTFGGFLHALGKDPRLTIEEVSHELDPVIADEDATSRLGFYGPSALLLYGMAGANLKAMRLLRVRRCAKSVPVRTSALIKADEFAQVFMEANLPCLLRDIKLGPEGLSRQTLAANADLADEIIPICDSQCKACNPTQEPRVEMRLADYFSCWLDHAHLGVPGYLKDWHFNAAWERSHAGQPPYEVPEWFQDDWLNEFCQVGDLNQSDFKFLYLGPAGSCTRMHHDVYRSYSWSYNVYGTKLWIMFPEGKEPRSIEGNIVNNTELIREWFVKASQRSELVMDDELYDIILGGLPADCPSKPLLSVQSPGDAIFVPSGWYHEVHNLEETLSLNTNWFNGHSLSRVNQFLLSEQAATQNALADCKETTNSHEEWDELVQRVMLLNAGMNRIKWFELLRARQQKYSSDTLVIESALKTWTRKI